MEQLLGTRKSELVATPFLILQTKTRGALPTIEKGLFVLCHVPLPRAQDAAGTQWSWKERKISYVHRLFCWACLMSSSQVGQFPFLYRALESID